MKWLLLIALSVFLGLYWKVESFRKGIRNIIDHIRQSIVKLYKRLSAVIVRKIDKRHTQLQQSLQTEVEDLKRQLIKKMQKISELEGALRQNNDEQMMLCAQNNKLTSQNNHLRGMHKYIYCVSEFVASEFRDQFSAIISLLNGGEEIIKNYYDRAILHQDNELIKKISAVYLEFVLEKPIKELQKWQNLVENLRYSGFIVDGIKNTLMNEPDDRRKILVLRKIIFQSLYREYIDIFLVMMESVAGIDKSRPEAKEIEMYISRFIEEIGYYGISIAYYPLFERITDFSKVEIIKSVEMPDSPVLSDSVVKIHKYAVNSPDLGITDEKSIVEIKM